MAAFPFCVLSAFATSQAVSFIHSCYSYRLLAAIVYELISILNAWNNVSMLPIIRVLKFFSSWWAHGRRRRFVGRMLLVLLCFLFCSFSEKKRNPSASCTSSFATIKRCCAHCYLSSEVLLGGLEERRKKGQRSLNLLYLGSIVVSLGGQGKWIDN